MSRKIIAWKSKSSIRPITTINYWFASFLRILTCSLKLLKSAISFLLKAMSSKQLTIDSVPKDHSTMSKPNSDSSQETLNKTDMSPLMIVSELMIKMEIFWTALTIWESFPKIISNPTVFHFIPLVLNNLQILTWSLRWLEVKNPNMEFGEFPWLTPKAILKWTITEILLLEFIKSEASPMWHGLTTNAIWSEMILLTSSKLLIGWNPLIIRNGKN